MEIGTDYNFNNLRNQNLEKDKRTYKANSDNPKKDSSIEGKDAVSIAEETIKAMNVKIEDVGEAVNLIKQVQGELLKQPGVGILAHQNLASERVMKLIG
ncbi:MAG: hypothetical protein QME40_02530 [bacterium]|nr:hypothetical protein [bacterium]